MIDALPVTRPPATRIDIHPPPRGGYSVNSIRRATTSPVLDLQSRHRRVAGDGERHRRGRLAQAGRRRGPSAVNTPRAQKVTAIVNTQGLPAAQSYLGKLTVVTNGGIVEVPVGFDVVAQPFPKTLLQGGPRTPCELAELHAAAAEIGRPDSRGQRGAALVRGQRLEVSCAASSQGRGRRAAILRGDGALQTAGGQAVAIGSRFAIAYPQSMKFQVSLQITSQMGLRAGDELRRRGSGF